MLLNLNKMRLMRQAEHTFSFRLQLISGSVTYLSIIFTSFFLQGFEFCKFLVVGNTEIKNRRQREREQEKKKYGNFGGSPIFFCSHCIFIFKTQKTKWSTKLKLENKAKSHNDNSTYRPISHLTQRNYKLNLSTSGSSKNTTCSPLLFFFSW